MKKAKDANEAYKMCDIHDGVPYVIVQWKGTDVCLDFQCECGEGWHIDGFFAYSIQCSSCKNTYWLNPNIEMIKLDKIPNGIDHCEPLTGM